MAEMTNREKLLYIVTTYSSKPQEDVAIEECAELQKAILKNRRNPSEEHRKDIIDEIADVEIMLEQLKIIHSCEKEVAERVDFKINRQINRILGKK